MNHVKDLEQELAIAKKLKFDKREIAKLESLLAKETKQQPPKQSFIKSIFTKLGVN